MSVLSDLQKVQAESKFLQDQMESLAKDSARHEEQMNGDRGLSAAINNLAEEMKQIKRSVWIVGAGIIVSSVGFAITALSAIGSG